MRADSFVATIQARLGNKGEKRARDANQLAKLIDAQGGRLAKPRREALR
jgi:hypothetical protein